jgi:hypothetical protein
MNAHIIMPPQYRVAPNKLKFAIPSLGSSLPITSIPAMETMKCIVYATEIEAASQPYLSVSG